MDSNIFNINGTDEPAHEIEINRSTDVVFIFDDKLSENGISAATMTMIHLYDGLDNIDSYFQKLDITHSPVWQRYFVDRFNEATEKEKKGELKPGDVTTFKHLAKNSKGEDIWIKTNIFFKFDENDSAEKMIVTIEDLSKPKEPQKILNEKENFEKLTNWIIENLLKITRHDEELTEKINSILFIMAKNLNADRVYLISCDGQYLSMTHEWCEGKRSNHKDHCQNISINKLSWLSQKIQENKNDLPVLNMKLFSEAKDDIEFLNKGEKESVIWVPIMLNDSLYGFLCFDYAERENNEIEGHSEALRIIANIFGMFFYSSLLWPGLTLNSSGK